MGVTAERQEELSLRRFTVDEYHLMGERGILAPAERVELVHGVVRTLSPKNRAHVIVTHRVVELLQAALRGRASVYQEAPIRMAELDSEPEPDILVCSNPDPAAYGTDRTRPLLVVEIAESSLGYDLGAKAELYAQANVPEYWVVNLVARSLVVFREPSGEAFRSRAEYDADARVAMLAWPDLEVAVGALFP